MPENQSLPPGQYLTRELPVAHVGSVPHFSPESWDFTVSGLVESPLTLRFDEFRALPRVEVVTDLHCVGTWSVRGLRWGGIPVNRLLVQARVLPEASAVIIHADGGYSASMTLADLRRENVIVADSLNGEPLSPEHGFPARLVVPHLYAYKSAKWIRAIELTPLERPGFWEARGYSDTADPWTEDRFAE